MEFLERWDKFIEGRLQRVVQKSLGAGASSDFLEAYAAALDDVAAKVQSVGGKRMFPYKRVVLKFSAADPEQRPALSRVLSQRKQLVAEVVRKLQEVGCERPTPLRVEGVAVGTDSGALGGRSYEVSFSADLPRQPALTLEIVTGQSEQSTYTLREPTVNVGRLAEVFGDRKRLIRRNHVVFADQNDGVNATVSRMHAHITFDQEVGWFRVFDDQSAFGTRICRGNEILDVPTGSQAGAWLRPGDELHLGQARLIAHFAEE